MLTFGSLFAGVGGFDLGFERAGMVCKWQVEIDDYATRVLERHWPHVRRHRDVRTFPPGDGDWRVDVICGGDPCQANTIAAGPSPSKAESLGGEFIRVVDALRPRIVVRENPTRVRRDAPWPWFRFRDGLESLGYVVLPFRLRACCLGLDTRRDRLFLLAERSDANSDGLEGWHGQIAPAVESEVVQTLVGPADGNHIRTMRGYRSRAGIPNYVDRMRCGGNSVAPIVAEWIGQRIVAAGPRYGAGAT